MRKESVQDCWLCYSEYHYKYYIKGSRFYTWNSNSNNKKYILWLTRLHLRFIVGIQKYAYYTNKSISQEEIRERFFSNERILEVKINKLIKVTFRRISVREKVYNLMCPNICYFHYSAHLLYFSSPAYWSSKDPFFFSEPERNLQLD